LLVQGRRRILAACFTEALRSIFVLVAPMVDRRLFEQAGFEVISVGPVRNTYSLSYLLHLVPLPQTLKTPVLSRLRNTSLGRRQATVPLGNLCLLARRAT